MKQILISRYIFWAIFFLTGSTFGQTTSSGVTQFSRTQVPSPQAASFNIYGDIPVSMHTGVPEISIPLFTIQEAGLSHSVSLNYHSSGIKVDQVASWVGLGWNLSAGGVITREIRGISDDGQVKTIGSPYTPNSTLPSDRGWISNKGLHPIYLDPECLEESAKIVWSTCSQPSSVPQCQAFYADAANGFIDTEPDIYTLSAGGYSGKFIFDQLGKPRFLIESDFEIETVLDGNGNIDSWLVVSPNGETYYFGGDGATEETHVVNAGDGKPTSNYNISTQSWYLTKIESINNSHWIEFSYVEEDYAFTNAKGHSAAFLCGSCGGSSSDPTYKPSGVDGSLTVQSAAPSVTYVFGVRLDEITTSSTNQKIEFIAGGLRTDLTGSAWGNNGESRELSEVRYTSGNHILRYSLEQDYFTGSSTLPNGAPSSHDRYRLKLLSIQKDNLTTTEEEPPYVFTYDETTALPRRLSLARDHWGFYNGALSNTGLIPSGVENPCVSNTFNGLANRNPSVSNMKAGILTEIQYPTGGETEFTYEAHKDDISGNTVGGLRIKSISKKDSDGSLISRDDYTYELGRLYSGFPDVSDGYIGSYVLLVGGDGMFPGSYTADGNICEDYLVLGTSYTPFTSTSGYHIGYEKVTKTQYSTTEDNGSEEFWYDNQLTYSYPNNANFPILPSQSGFKLGTLLKHIVKDKNDVIIQEFTNTYAFEEIGRVGGMVTSLFEEQIYNPGSNGTPPLCGNPQTLLYPIYRSYNLIYGRVRNTTSISKVDGVTSSVEYHYSVNHGNPIKTTTENSDGVFYQGLTYYPQDFLPDYLCGDYNYLYVNFLESIENNFKSGLAAIWTDPNNFDSQGKVVNTTQFTNSYNSSVEDYLDALWSPGVGQISIWEECNEDENADWVALNPLAAEFIDRNLITPVKTTSNFSQNNGSSYTLNGADSIQYVINNFAGTYYLQPQKYLAMKVDALGGGGNTWEVRQTMSLDEGDLLKEVEEPYSGVHRTSIWDTESRITAVISNAESNECAYSGFEIAEDYSSDANGNWTITNLGSGGNNFNSVSFSGEASLDLTNQKFASFSPPNGRKYVLSFWAENSSNAFVLKIGGSSSGLTPEVDIQHGSGWRYYEYMIDLTNSSTGTTQIQLTGSGSVSGANLVDELRIFPEDAQMMSYTYNAADLVECISDPNGKHIFYEYDGLNRLEITRDQDGNIIKKVTPKFINQPN